MSDSETEFPSDGCVEGESGGSEAQHTANKRRKVMSSSSEGGDEGEEEEQQQQPASSSRAALSDGEEEEGAAALVNDGVNENVFLTEEGDDDGDSVDTDSSGEVPGAETCAICLGRMRGEVGSPESCEHTFCLICILEWAKTNASCPQDRKAFSKVMVRMALGVEEVEREVVITKQEEELVVIPETENLTYCEVCNQCNREERLLLCDGCDLGYHLECLDPPLEQVPVEEWFCPVCSSADIPSTVAGQRTLQGESSTSRRRPRRQPSSSQRPRLIPRTRATERVRDRIIRKRREKRKRRRLNRKRKIESGEVEDLRPAVHYRDRLMFFGSITGDIAAEDSDDTFADHLLAGVSGPAGRDPVARKTDAAKVLHDAVFTPSTSYVGKASVAVMNRVNDQSEEAREDDVLSSILENQTIVLTNSKKLSLTSDRKLKKEGEAGDPDSFTLRQEDNSIMSEPLPSRRASKMDGEGKDVSLEDDRRHSSPSRSRGSSHSGFTCHSFYSRNSNYGYSSRRSESSHRTQREERIFKEEMIQREERLSGTVHQSPLEDRRRSPPRMSYQRHPPPHQFRNQRNAAYDHRNRDSRSRWNDRQRRQGTPPWKDSGSRQNHQSGDSRWGPRPTESSSSSSSREPSSQERHGRNGKDNGRENPDHGSYRASSDRRGGSPASAAHRSFCRNDEGDKYHSWREEDRRRKEDRGYHRHHHQRDHSHHRNYKSSYRKERDSQSSHSSRRSRSCSRSPVRSESPSRSRSPVRSRSRSRYRENSSRVHEDSRERRKAHRHTSNDSSAHRLSLSPSPPGGTLEATQQQDDSGVVLGNDSGSGAKPSPPSRPLDSPEPLPEVPDDYTPEDRPLEAKSRTTKSKGESTLADGSVKTVSEVKREREDIRNVKGKCDDNEGTDHRHEAEETNVRKPKTWTNKEEKRKESNVETEDNLLNDAKSIDFMVQSSFKGDPARDKTHTCTEPADSRRNGRECGSESPAGVNGAKDTSKEQQQQQQQQHSQDADVHGAENPLGRKKRKQFVSGFYGRVWDYTPEVELSHWDENSAADASSPFMVIKKHDTSESDRGISLPFPLQKLLPGEKGTVQETDGRKKTPREGKQKHRRDSDNRREEERNVELQKNKDHETQNKPEKTDTDRIKEGEAASPDKSHKKRDDHKAPKADTKPHKHRPKDTVSPSSSHSSAHSSAHSSRSKERFEKVSVKESASQGKDTAAQHTSIKQDKTHPHSCSFPSTKNSKQSHKKEPAEKSKFYQDIFGDVDDIINNSEEEEDDDDERNAKLIQSCPILEKQKDIPEKELKLLNDKDTVKKSEHKKKSLKGDEMPTKVQRLEGSVSSSQKDDTKSKNQGKGTRNIKPQKGQVLDLFGNTSDSDGGQDTGAEAGETKRHKTPERPKSSPVKSDSHHRKGREASNTHKERDKGSEKVTSPHRKSSEETLKDDSSQRKRREATDTHKTKDGKLEKVPSPKKLCEEEPKSSSESLKGDSVSRKGQEVTSSHRVKDGRYEKLTSHRKSSEETPKSSDPLKDDSVPKKGKETLDTHKSKDRKLEKVTSPHTKSSEEAPKSSSEALKGDSKKVKEATDSHNKGRERKSEKDTPSHRKSSEEAAKTLLSESHKSDSLHRKGHEGTDTHKDNKSKCEKETSPHRKPPEDPQTQTREAMNNHEEVKDGRPQEKKEKTSAKPQKTEPSMTGTNVGEVTEERNNHEQKAGHSQEVHQKALGKLGNEGASGPHDNHNQADHKKGKEATDTPRSQPERDKRPTQATTEEPGGRKAGCPSEGDGNSHSSRKRKSGHHPEEKTREKDPGKRTENKSLPAPASSLHPARHASDKKEKKDVPDTYIKMKASLELKVVTEVKKWLDPHYRDKSITKDEYKEIVAKCVCKVVSAECGDVIESEKMHSLVEGYVKLYRHRRAKQQQPPAS